MILKVPIGTQVFEEDNNTLIYDFTKIKKNTLWHRVAKVVLNVRFKSSTNRAPRKRLMGSWEKNSDLASIKSNRRYWNNR